MTHAIWGPVVCNCHIKPRPELDAVHKAHIQNVVWRYFWARCQPRVLCSKTLEAIWRTDLFDALDEYDRLKKEDQR